jgi:hypothetical protein
VREQPSGQAREPLVAPLADDRASGVGQHSADRDAPSRYDCHAISIAARHGAPSALHDAPAEFFWVTGRFIHSLDPEWMICDHAYRRD